MGDLIVKFANINPGDWQINNMNLSWSGLADYFWVANYPRYGKTEMINKIKNNELIPEKIIFNDRTTICFFRDGTKITATCMEDQEFDSESGVSVCIAKKVLGDHSKLRHLVEKAKWQELKEKK